MLHTFVFRFRHGTQATIVIFPRLAYVGFEAAEEPSPVWVGECKGSIGEPGGAIPWSCVAGTY